MSWSRVARTAGAGIVPLLWLTAVAVGLGAGLPSFGAAALIVLLMSFGPTIGALARRFAAVDLRGSVAVAASVLATELFLTTLLAPAWIACGEPIAPSVKFVVSAIAGVVPAVCYVAATVSIDRRLAVPHRLEIVEGLGYSIALTFVALASLAGVFTMLINPALACSPG